MNYFRIAVAGIVSASLSGSLFAKNIGTVSVRLYDVRFVLGSGPTGNIKADIDGNKSQFVSGLTDGVSHTTSYEELDFELEKIYKVNISGLNSYSGFLEVEPFTNCAYQLLKRQEGETNWVDVVGYMDDWSIAGLGGVTNSVYEI